MQWNDKAECAVKAPRIAARFGALGLTRLPAPSRRVARPSAAGLAAALALLCAGAPAGARPPYARFGFCAQPAPPACADASTKDARRSSACQEETERYVAMVFAYRTCLNAEMERAVSEANQVIRSVRCARDKRFCAEGAAGLADRPSPGPQPR